MSDRLLSMPSTASETGSDRAVRKKFHVAGVVDAEKHYVIDRSAWHATLAEKLEGGEFTLLHAHRQGGKSSAARAVRRLLLSQRNKICVLTCSMESVRPVDAKTMWKSLAAQLRDDAMAMASMASHLIPPKISSLVAEGPLFKDSETFQTLFGTGLWDGTRVVLIIDEFDVLLEAPADVRHELLTSLRSLRTHNSIAQNSTALHSVLGIGVYRLLQLTESERRAHSPFNVSDVMSMPHTKVEQVEFMLREFASDIGRNIPESVVHDIYWRSGGHVGLLSMLGQQLANLCDRLHPGATVDDAAWLAVTSGSTLLGEMRASATISSMLHCVSSYAIILSSPVALAARDLVRKMLSAPEDTYLDVIDGGTSVASVLAYLLTEGVIVEDRRGDGTTVHRIVAPMVVPLLMRDIGSNALVSRLPRLPFPRRPDNTVNLKQTVLELLPFINLNALYHPFARLKSGQPCEYAYHFQLFDLLAHRVGDGGGWRVLGETRNSSLRGPLRRLDLLIASNGCRCGIELLVNGDQLEKHVHEQAPAYRAQQDLSSVLVLNFACSQSDIKNRLQNVPPSGVDLLQVLVDRPEESLTPYILEEADGCTAVALTKMKLERADVDIERLIAPLPYDRSFEMGRIISNMDRMNMSDGSGNYLGKTSRAGSREQDLAGALELLKNPKSAKTEADFEALTFFLAESGVDGTEELGCFVDETLERSKEHLKPAKQAMLLSKLRPQ